VKLSPRVVKENPALRLYSWLKFEIAGEDEISHEMAWNENKEDSKGLMVER
jgi:hypothetical protein